MSSPSRNQSKLKLSEESGTTVNLGSVRRIASTPNTLTSMTNLRVNGGTATTSRISYSWTTTTPILSATISRGGLTNISAPGNIKDLMSLFDIPSS